MNYFKGVVCMANKDIIPILIVFVIILALVGLYYVYEAPDNDLDNVKLYVYSEGPINLSDLIEDVETSPYYEGYDNDTLNWMKSLGDKYVFSGNGTFVVMDYADANRIPSQYATDVIIIEHIECDVVENRSLGNIESPKDVILVKNVVHSGEEIIDLGLA